MSAEQRAALNAQLGVTKPATDSLLNVFAESITNMREHDHGTQREDWYCLNLAAYMGEKAAPVLRRLLDAETDAERLRAELEQWRAQRNQPADDNADLHSRLDEAQDERLTAQNDSRSARQEVRQLRAELQERDGHTGKSGCAHVWTTALDGDDRPALDEHGRTWEHCGVCGVPKDVAEGGEG